MAADEPTDPRPPLRAKDDDRDLIEHRIDSARVFQGSLLDVRRDRVRLPDGGEATREYIVHPGAVLVVPILDDERVVVVRQFRYPPNTVFVEFPAGKIDAGEPPEETARRELREETGYVAARWSYIGRIHPVVSYSTEAIELYVARDLTPVGAALDHGEFLEVDIVRVEELFELADRGELTDAKTLAALYHFARGRFRT